MDLEKNEITTLTSYTGKDAFSLSAKGKLRLRKKEHGGEFSNFLNEQVPDNKKWEIVVTVNITETDV